MPVTSNRSGRTTHWRGKKPDPSKYFGFVYEITNKLDGRKYIGRKVYWTKNTSRKIVVKDMDNPGWCPDHWKESDWKRYISSSKSLKEDIYEHGMENFEFKILSQWRSSSALRYVECRTQWSRKVLETDGYYNNWIEEYKGPAPAEVTNGKTNRVGRHYEECV